MIDYHNRKIRWKLFIPILFDWVIFAWFRCQCTSHTLVNICSHTLKTTIKAIRRGFFWSTTVYTMNIRTHSSSVIIWSMITVLTVLLVGFICVPYKQTHKFYRLHFFHRMRGESKYCSFLFLSLSFYYKMGAD